MAYQYFHFSLDQMNERKLTFDKLNKVYIPGTVVFNGEVHEFTARGPDKKLPRYADAKLVAEGELKELTFTDYTTRQKGVE